MRAPRSLLAGILLAALLPAAARAQDALTTIEGHVFNKGTGIPLEDASVVVAVFDDEWTLQGTSTSYTDSNGFWDVEVNTAYFVRIEVLCRTNRGVLSSAVNPPRLGPEIVRRDAYLDGPDRRSFRRCRRPAETD